MLAITSEVMKWAIAFVVYRHQFDVYRKLARHVETGA